MACFALLAATPALAGPEKCVPCHPAEVEHYLQTGMGRSMAVPGESHPTGAYGHGLSGAVFRTDLAEGGLSQEIVHQGLRARYDVAYVIGSGKAAFGFLVRVGDSLFQSPVAYYAERGRWGMAPGMESEEFPDFSRPATPECLWCHAGGPRPVAAAINRYEEPYLEPLAISCDRCHGPSRRHLAAPRAESIFNPVRAGPRERDSVCEQCHLGGVVRVLHPDRDFGAFEPGRRLEEYWTVFVGDVERPGEDGQFQVVSHVEQLALSQCAQQSGDRFWCGTCHDPHSPPDRLPAEYSDRCIACHSQALSSDHLARAPDCVQCHMPRRRSHDSGHSAFTDHRIQLRPAKGRGDVPPVRLRPWAPVSKELLDRGMGIAYVRHGQRLGSAELVSRGVERLRQLPLSSSADKDALDALGTGLVISGSLREGLRLLEAAIVAGDAGALHYNGLAAAWWEAGDSAKAIQMLEEAIRREPALESSYQMLASIRAAVGQGEEASRTWERLLAVRPRLLRPRLKLRAQPSESIR